MDENKTPCDCGVVSWMLNDPESGLKLNEDNMFTLGDEWIVYHCPSCGGRLPHSSKPIWYPRLTNEEQARLQQLIEGIQTPEEAIERLGPPDYDSPMHTIESVGGRMIYNEALSNKCRNVEYYHLSEVANIEFYFYTDKPPFCHIQLKNISPRHMVAS